jgi:hypothetical protein
MSPPTRSLPPHALHRQSRFTGVRKYLAAVSALCALFVAWMAAFARLFFSRLL